MTATRRGKSADPRFDIYDTPMWCMQALLDEVRLPGGLWVEPCAGSGVLVEATTTRRSDVAWELVELREECLPGLQRLSSRVYTQDAREWSAQAHARGMRYDVIVTNPPFSLAFELLQSFLPLASWVILLLRIGFIGSKARQAFFRRLMPDTGVLIPRPQFGNRPIGKASDSTEYGWFIWGPNRERSRGEWFVLPTPPEYEQQKKRKPLV